MAVQGNGGTDCEGAEAVEWGGDARRPALGNLDVDVARVGRAEVVVIWIKRGEIRYNT